MWLSEQIILPLHSEATFREKKSLPRSSLMASQDPIHITATNRLCEVRSSITNSTLTQIKW